MRLNMKILKVTEERSYFIYGTMNEIALNEGIEIKVFPKSIQAFINLLNKLSKNDVYYLKA